MIELANSYPEAEGIQRRTLNQAARELLLAQSSDWPFIMKSGTMVEYAKLRFQSHIANFTRLYEGIKSNAIDEGWLYWIENSNNLFPDIDYRVYQTHHITDLPGPLSQVTAVGS